jgi:hypothetical protein
LYCICDNYKAMDVTSSVLLKFADYTKVARVVESDEQREELQSTINKLVEWSVEWQMLFNAGKCHLLHLCRGNAKYEYTIEGWVLEAVEFEKDVGVLVHQSLKPSMQSAKNAARANGILGQLSRAVCYHDKDTFMKLYKVYVRPPELGFGLRLTNRFEPKQNTKFTVFFLWNITTRNWNITTRNRNITTRNRNITKRNKNITTPNRNITTRNENITTQNCRRYQNPRKGCCRVPNCCMGSQVTKI